MAVYDVWYMKPEFFRDGIMGMNWLVEHGLIPDPADLTKSHIRVRVRSGMSGLESVYAAQQAERWSPNGEARDLIEALGLCHTSMSVGDIAVNMDTKEVFVVDRIGFVRLDGEYVEPQT